MQIEVATNTLKELGHPVRLCIYKEVVRYGRFGVSVGVLQDMLDIPNSTLSHHIASLVHVGLISKRREGRTLYCFAHYTMLDGLIAFLQSECCLDS